MSTPNFMNSMNLGGGAGGTASKTAKLFAGLRDELTKIQPIMDRLVQSTQKVAENLTKAKGASSTLFPGASGEVTSTGFLVESSSGMSFNSFMGGMKKAAAVGLTAMSQAINLDQFAESSMSRARIGFFSGQGSAAAAASFQSTMNRGTGTDPLDAARAAMAGTSMGLNPALGNYNTVLGGAATFSNLVPGAGISGGMGAMAALNSASNVNRLRMIGINVRDAATGMMRSADAIANDLWSKLNREKSGSSPITKRDIAMSLQSGNALDMMINQYFGNDPVLRQGVVTALMQKASGGDLSKESLIATGALPELADSTGKRNAAAFGAINAYTGSVEQGMITANEGIAAAANAFRDSANVFGGAVQAFATAVQFAGGGNGAFGTVGGAALSGAANFAGSFLGSKFGGGGSLKSMGASAMTGLKNASPFLKGAGVAGAGLSAAGQFASGTQGQGFDWGTAALTSIMAGLPFIANPLVAGAVALGSFGVQYGANMAGNATRGEGDGSDGTGATSGSNPLEQLTVNAEWHKKRDYLINGRPPANPYHTGVDLNAAENSQVFAVKDGVVTSVKDNGKNGFGKSIGIKHKDGYTSIYGHLNAQGVRVGDNVTAGQPIGLSGNTGLSSGPHLHFEVRSNGADQSTNVDPMAYISGSSSPKRAADFSAESAAKSSGSGSSLLGEMSSGVQLLPGLMGSPNPNGEGDGGGIGGFGGTTNYGGVTVHINVPKGTNLNEQTLAKEIKRVINDQDMLRKAVTR